MTQFSNSVAPATLAILYFAVRAQTFFMKIPIELSAESRDLLVRHFKKGADLHQTLEHATRKDLAGIEIYSFKCDLPQAETLLQMRSLFPVEKPTKLQLDISLKTAKQISASQSVPNVRGADWIIR